MKDKILNNFGLKIASLVLAFVVWLIVVNVNDPMITRTITGVPVALTNTAYVESLGMSCRVESGANTVSVTVSGHRSIVEPLTREMVHAEGDLTQIVSLDADPVMVPVSIQIGGVDSTNISAVPGNIEVVLEEMQSADFMVTPTAGDTRPYNTSYQVGSMTSYPDRITITGPASLIGIIDRVMASVDVSTLVSDTSVETNLEIYDKNGQAFTDVQMDSLRFSEEDGVVAVQVDLWTVVSGIGVRAETSGTPAEGFRIGDVTITPAEISVVGSESALRRLEKNGGTITIPAEMLDVTGLDADQDERISLTEVLPDGIRLAEGVAETAVVSIEIMALDSRTIEIPTGSIAQQGLAEGLALVFQREKIRVRLQGSGEAFSAIEAGDVAASIDLSGVSAGTQIEVPVTVTVDAENVVVEPVTAIVDIVEIENNTEETSSDE